MVAKLSPMLSPAYQWTLAERVPPPVPFVSRPSVNLSPKPSRPLSHGNHSRDGTRARPYKGVCPCPASPEPTA